MSRWISHHHSIVAGMAAAILLGCAATPAFAQLSGGNAPMVGGDADDAKAGKDGSFISSISAPIRNVTASSLRTTDERRAFDADDLELRRVDMDEDELREDITQQLGRTGVQCGVRNFQRVGMTPGRHSIYEASCDSGPGYVLVNGTEPTATNCLVLAGAATNALRRNPNARTGAQCTLAENLNGPQVIGGWAREAGVTCRVDEAQWLGSSDAGFDIYEIGCAGSEGFWLEKAASGWSLRGCLQVNSEGLNCRYTNAAEQRAWMRARLAGTPAEACDVAEIRMVGVSAQGNYYETRCTTPGEGYLLRIAREERAEEVKSCAAAARTTACTMSPGRPSES